MHDILCPHCGKAFKIDESSYADILQQVRDAAFEQQLHERLTLAEQEKQTAIELATIRLSQEWQQKSAVQEVEIEQLKSRLAAGDPRCQDSCRPGRFGRRVDRGRNEWIHDTVFARA